MRTVLLGSPSAAFFEFVISEAGSYVMGDPHFANAAQGSVDIITGGGSAGDPRASQHPGQRHAH